MLEKVHRTVEANEASLETLPEILWLKEQYPVLKDCRIRVSDNPTFEGGGFNLPDPENGMPYPEVEIARGGEAFFALLKQKRRLAVEKMATSLERSVADMDGTSIRKFIIFHELGHVYDFLVNFGGEKTDQLPEVIRTWYAMSEEQLMTLPFPGWAPSDIREAVIDMGSFDTWRTHAQWIAEWCEEHHVTSLEQLLELQEDAYRLLPKETFADTFSAQAMKAFEASRAVRAR